MTGADLVPGDTRTTELAYAVADAPPAAPERYLVDRVARRSLWQGFAGTGTLVRRTRFFYDHHASETDPPSQGRLTKRIDVANAGAGSGPTTTFDHDAYGNVVLVASPRINAGDPNAGAPASIGYDPPYHTFVATSSNSLGHTTVFSYAAAACPGGYPQQGTSFPPAAGLVASIRGPNQGTGEKRVFCYDAFGRSLLDRMPDGEGQIAETTWAYDDTPGAIAVLAESGGGKQAALSRIDGLGRAYASEIDGPGASTILVERAFDTAGRVFRESDPRYSTEAPRETEYQFDVLGRPRFVRLPGDPGTPGGDRLHAFTYDRGLTSYLGPENTTRETLGNPFGEIVEVREPGAGGTLSTFYTYDAAGGLRTITDPAGNVTTLDPDLLGRREALDDPDVGSSAYSYDENGNLAVETLAIGTPEQRAISWTYDALDRPKTRSAPGLPGATWSYDSAEHGIGRFYRQIDESGTYTVEEYDLLGQALEERQEIAGTELAFANAFDELGQRKTRTLPTGRVLTWERDARGYLTGIRSGASEALVSGLAWEAAGRLAAWTAGNGTQTQRSFDPATGRLASASVVKDSTALLSLLYGFDDADRLKTITDPTNVHTQGFEYDALDRLTKATGRYVDPGSAIDLYYHYDALGNLSCLASDSPTACTGAEAVGFTFPAPGQPRPHGAVTAGGVALTYTATGEIVSHGPRSYEYRLGSLASITDAGTLLARYTYDAQGSRVTSTDRTGPRELVQHFAAADFEWDATRRLARTHVFLAGEAVATLVEPFAPEEAAAAPLGIGGPPLPRGRVGLVVVAGLSLAAGLLLLELARRRREGRPLLEPALAGGTALLLVFAPVHPVRAVAPQEAGDLNGDGGLDVGDLLRMLQLVEGEPPQAGEAERGDVAPVSAPNAAIDGGDAVVLLRALRGEDVDGDGLSTREERETFASNPFLADTDGDGTPDGAEDPDGDGLTHLAELQAGTDPWLADTDGDGLLDGPDAEPLRGTRYRHADHLGSPVVETGAAPGAIASAAYRPYGQSSAAGGFGYTGQRHEAGVSLYDYKARWYDPALGRFLQPDPIVGDAYDPQALNPYSYVRGSPTNFTDPTGLSPLNDLGVALGFGPGALAPLTSYPQDAIPGYGIGSLSERPGLVDSSSFTLFSSITHSGSDPTGGGLQVSGAGSARGIPERQRLDQTTSGGESSSHDAVGLPPGIGPFDPTPDYDLGPGNGLIPNAYNCGGSFCEPSVNSAAELAMVLPVLRAVSGASKVLTRTPRALQKFFTKHGADFGLKGNWNPARATDASRAIHQHINNPAVRALEGTYRGNPVTHYLDPGTGLNVIAGPGGNFVSGWRLGAEQLDSVLTTGRL